MSVLHTASFKEFGSLGCLWQALKLRKTQLEVRSLNPRRDTVFRHLRSDRGGGVRPPWSFQTKRRRASRKRPVDCSRRVLAIGGIIFGPRSIFDPVMAGKRPNFRKFYAFSTLRVHISKTFYCSGMKPSPACFPFNSAQNKVSRLNI